MCNKGRQKQKKIMKELCVQWEATIITFKVWESYQCLPWSHDLSFSRERGLRPQPNDHQILISTDIKLKEMMTNTG